MSKPVTVEITETGFLTLSLLKGYMSAFYSGDDLSQLLTELIETSTALIQDVAIGPVCPELAPVGIHDYRQLNLMKHYKVLYRFDDQSGKGYVIAFMRQKQSAEKLLVDLALM
ncbi:hypothetical protein [Endozoicomonas sp. GU-1]|uniref:hypothetical protein n=1 Tax=Endozoicomonas sp. GU-1 TaxID=3009078 RepID=UPI0022B32230|nr:hypothetical protein [Endozoicomonas sp. GU-1]WBA81987.1 hypothetical protein O2T12_02125 [Endozoicomonas sp. GU-1]WBA84936.1 hypothetical protein O3276_16895 [Endozoicomonas sp. GU-1]